jgi:hypothetical protein
MGRRLGIFGFDHNQAHQVEHGKQPTSLDHNLLAQDVETALRRADGAKEGLVRHGEDHVQPYETASLRRRLDAVEEKQWAAPTAADVEGSAIRGIAIGALGVLAISLLVKAVAGAAGGEAEK